MLGPYLDGELETATFIELDEHIGACDTCREEAKLLSAMRGSLKRVLQTSPPHALRERIGNALRAERVREAHSHAETDALGAGTWPVRLASWRTMGPLATAAAFALLWGAASRSPQPASSEARAGFGDDLLAELVAEHSRPLPPDATGPEAVRKLGRYVDVPVRPASFERGGARFVGGRVMPTDRNGRPCFNTSSVPAMMHRASAWSCTTREKSKSTRLVFRHARSVPPKCEWAARKVTRSLWHNGAA